MGWARGWAVRKGAPRWGPGGGALGGGGGAQGVPHCGQDPAGACARTPRQRAPTLAPGPASCVTPAPPNPACAPPPLLPPPARRWCGSEEGLEVGRECFDKWGLKRAEDIVRGGRPVSRPAAAATRLLRARSGLGARLPQIFHPPPSVPRASAGGSLPRVCLAPFLPAPQVWLKTNPAANRQYQSASLQAPHSLLVHTTVGRPAAPPGATSTACCACAEATPPLS